MNGLTSIQDYSQYATLTKGREVLHGFLWDTLNYTSAATLTLTFFQNTVAATSYDVTNIQTPGLLPFPQKFLVRALRFFVKQRPFSLNNAGAGAVAAAVQNVSLLVNTGLFVLNIGSKEYGRYPLRSITAGNGPMGSFDVSNVLINGAGVDYGQNGQPDSNSIFTLSVPLLIETSQNFNVVLTWPAALTIVQSPLPICVAMEGDIIRAIQ